MKVTGVLANCHDSYPNDTSYARCFVATHGYLAIPDGYGHPTAVVLEGRITQVPLSKLSPACSVNRLGRLGCKR